MAYHRKFQAATVLDADILIVPECASLEVLRAKGYDLPTESFLWAGDNVQKGLAVIARAPYRIEPLYTPTESLPIWVIPARTISPDGAEFDLMAVWSFGYRDVRNRNGNTIVAALKLFSDRFTSKALIVAGDFNNSVVWDHGSGRDHIATSKALAALGLVSAYHGIRNVAYGEEPDPTIFWQKRTLDGPRYHIDFIYVPRNYVEHEMSVEIGSHSDWVGSGLSDHVPLLVDTACMNRAVI